MSARDDLTLFVGGPYDGRHLDLDPSLVKFIRLPDIEDWDFEADSQTTVSTDCPLVYEADMEAIPPCYRFVGPAGPAGPLESV